jgi:Fe-S cluster assembly iron-binding protein IscA
MVSPVKAGDSKPRAIRNTPRTPLKIRLTVDARGCKKNQYSISFWLMTVISV